MIQYFEQNQRGRDYVIGDIHGNFQKLYRELDTFFDYNNDRLFSVGDLVDRGPDSAQVLELLDRDWFYAVRGNHEELILDAYRDGLQVPISIMNGGAWFQDDKALLDVGMMYAYVAPSAVPIVLAMEYRVHANSWLSDKVWVDAFLETKQTRGPSAGDIPEVWAMLIADKVQNYKDFLAYHNGSHPRTVELNYYFKAWLKYLKVDNYEQYL